MSLPDPTALRGPDRDLVQAFLAAGQGRVFRFWDRLDAAEREALLSDARGIDLELVARLAGEVLGEETAAPSLEPIEPIRPDAPDRAEAVEAGRELLRRGGVAFYTVAGGQGTRLGYDGPKGCYPIGPVSGKTLFEWHAEKVRAASRRYGTELPWVILVSSTNEAETRTFFEANGWFGLEGRVDLVRQRMLPAVDGDGRILLRSPSRIALSPNGHGGSIEAISRGGLLDRLADRGVELVSYFQVDNALLDPADPAFLGYHRIRNAEMSAKVVPKKDPFEPAGVVVRMDGRPGVLEYTELPDDLATATDDSGRLLYGLANIAAHVLSVDFLARVQGVGLPHHVAKKKVGTVDDDGEPTTVEGRKFETFIFDAIPLARGFNVFLTERSEEFAPLKKAEGDGSPETVRAALLARTRRWYEAAGMPAPAGETEVSPIMAYDLETFLTWVRGGEDEG